MNSNNNLHFHNVPQIFQTEDEDQPNCEYYNIDDLNSLYKSNPNSLLRIYHVNIRSLHANADEFVQFVNSCDFKFDVYVLSEIWAGNIQFYQNLLPGYTLYYNTPVNCRAGGVAFYVADTFTVELQDNLKVTSQHFELLCINLSCNKIKSKYSICGVYRHPGSPVNDFTENVCSILSQLPPSRKCIFVGDCNIDIKHYSTCNSTKLYVDDLISLNYLPLVFLPTRVTHNTETIIDHVFCNFVQQCTLKSGIITTDYTDHMSNFLFVMDNINQISIDRPLIRIYSTKNFNDFYLKLNAISWANVYQDTNPNSAFNTFYDTFYSTFNECFPLIKASRSWVKNKGWVTPALKKSIQTKSRLYKLWVKNKNAVTENNYKIYANILKKVIKKAKTEFNKSIFNNRVSNAKSMWKQINRVFSKNAPKSSNNNMPTIIHNNKDLKDDKEKADAFSEYFASVGENLAKNIPSSTVSYTNYLPVPNPNSIYLDDISYEELLASIISLKNSKSTGPDDLSCFIIKSARVYIIEPLLHIFNLSISQGIFPDKLKVARICPIFKKGEKKYCSNYRPIALTSTFGKLLEKIIYKRMLSFLNKYNLIYEYQFGFRENYSTSLALIEVMNMINTECKNNYVLGIFIDLQKAFDTVNHKILFEKLYNLGIRGKLLNWIKSFLSDRYIFTKINKSTSGNYLINCGVPQGCVLSSLLFLLYINDFKYAIDQKLRLFADDSNIFIISNNLQELFRLGNETLKAINTWLSANQLSLNTSKSNYMIFKLKDEDKEFIQSNNLNLSLNNVNLTKTSNTKYLGMIINDELNWKDHISELMTKLKSYNGIFYKYRNYLSEWTGRSIYFALILSKILYGIELYGISKANVIHPLEITCNKLLRNLQNVHYRYPTKDLYSNYNTLPVSVLFHFTLCKLMFKCVHTPSSMPPVICNKLCFNRNIHSYSTRNRNDFHFLNSDIHSDPLTIATHIWNKLPVNIKFCTNYNQFIKLLRVHFQSR